MRLLCWSLQEDLRQRIRGLARSRQAVFKARVHVSRHDGESRSMTWVHPIPR